MFEYLNSADLNLGAFTEATRVKGGTPTDAAYMVGLMEFYQEF